MLAFTFTAFLGSPLDSKVGAIEAATLDLVASLQALWGRLATSLLVMSSGAAMPRFLCLLGGWFWKEPVSWLRRESSSWLWEEQIELGREKSSIAIEHVKIQTLNESACSTREFNTLMVECAKLRTINFTNTYIHVIVCIRHASRPESSICVFA